LRCKAITLEIICFDVHAPFATYRTPDTNRGFFTFPFPPKTAIVGLLGAIMGTEKRNAIYAKNHYLSQTKIALQVMKEPRMIAFRTNLYQTKNIINLAGRTKLFLPKDLERGLRTPSNIPILQDIHYRLFVKMPDKEQSILKERLINHETFYPIYCGHANMRAYFEYQGIVQIEENKKKTIELLTLTQAEEIQALDKGKFTIIMNVPFDYQYKTENDRIELSKIANVIYHIDSIDVTLSDDSLEAFKIVKSPIKEQIGKAIIFL
jgi:CRISPR-associated protein Cas5 subtype I-B